jgi:hypothetical protein
LGGCWFFTVNLLGRRSTLPADKTDAAEYASAREGRALAIPPYALIATFLTEI